MFSWLALLDWIMAAGVIVVDLSTFDMKLFKRNQV